MLAAARIPAAVKAALERVGLTDAADRRFRGYSLGMKQRLGLAAALLLPRCLVVLDEPTNGLDPAGTRDVRRIIAELHESGATVIVSSHLLAEVEATCTHVAVLQAGSLVAAGELRTLLDTRRGRPGGRHAGRRAGPAHAARGRRSPPTSGEGVEPAVVVGDDGPPTRRRSRCWSAPGSRCTRPDAAGPTWTSCSRS